MSSVVYPVVLIPENGGYVVRIPDFDSGTQGDNIADAIMMARDAIGLLGITKEDRGKPIPEPSTAEPEHAVGELVAWVDIDFQKYRLMHDHKSMRINISIPRYLKMLGEEAGINFSGELQTRLKEVLRVA
jgi:predicted RNase H-like HicB family nuclease